MYDTGRNTIIVNLHLQGLVSVSRLIENRLIRVPRLQFLNILRQYLPDLLNQLTPTMYGLYQQSRNLPDNWWRLNDQISQILDNQCLLYNRPECMRCKWRPYNPPMDLNFRNERAHLDATWDCGCVQ